MTNKEIIKALECCLVDGCDICSCSEEADCVRAMAENAIDLINRQRKEIERLKKETKMFADIGKMYSGIKAELINIFVGVLKEKASARVMVANGIEVYGTKIYSINEIELEKLVDEMVGAYNA